MATESDPPAGSDPAFERALQALLDAQPLPRLSAIQAPPGADPGRDPLRVVDALWRAYRRALFGKDDATDPSGATRWGRLELRAEIGRGASGTVYRAWDPRLAREVALKLVAGETDPEVALQEGRLLARLNHPNIVRVFDADTHEGTTGIWMELLEGETLDEVLARDGLFGPEETLLIGLDLARALAPRIRARAAAMTRMGKIAATRQDLRPAGSTHDSARGAALA